MDNIDIKSILYKKEYNPETKVYNIGRILHDEGHLNDDLWYAILELKNKYLKNILILNQKENN